MREFLSALVGDRSHRKDRRRPSGEASRRPRVRTAAPDRLDTRWVVLVEDGEVVTRPAPCLFGPENAALEAATAMHGASPGVTARVGTMRMLLDLPLGLRPADFDGERSSS